MFGDDERLLEELESELLLDESDKLWELYEKEQAKGPASNRSATAADESATGRRREGAVIMGPI